MSIDKILRRQGKEILAMEDHQRQVVLSSLLQAKAEIRAKLESLPRGTFTAQQAQRVLGQVNTILDSVEARIDLTPYTYGIGYSREIVLEQSGAAQASLVGLFSPSIRLDVLKQVQLDGINKIKNIIPDLKQAIENQVRASVLQGEGISKTINRIVGTGLDRGVFRRAEWRAELVARTTTNEFVNKGAMSGYLDYAAEFPELSLRKQWVAENDRRTSQICRTLRGEIRELNEPFSLGFMQPPSHVNCRSRVIAVSEKYKPRKQEPQLSTLPLVTSASNDPRVNAAVDRGRDFLLAKDAGTQLEKYERLVRLRDATTDIYYTLPVQSLATDFAQGRVTSKQYTEGVAKLNQRLLKHPATEVINRLTTELDDWLESSVMRHNLTSAKLQQIRQANSSTVYGVTKSGDLDLRRSVSNHAENALYPMPTSVLNRVPTRVEFTDKKISSYNPQSLLATYSRNSSDLKKTVYHEMNHALDSIEDNASVSAMWRQSRTRKEGTLRELGYDSNAPVAIGKFPLNSYAGRVYKQRGVDVGTEIMSTASERLASGTQFFDALQRDPEHLYFYLGRLFQ